jgi:hypothetical protein
MLAAVAVGCGICLGLVAAELAAPLYWRVLTAWPFGHGRLARLFLRAQRGVLARTGHHPYLVDSLEALERAADPAALIAAQARLRWWRALRVARRP